MGRWRPPQAKSSPYITPPGYADLQVELKALWRRRADVVKALSAAAAEGDRSENAEYIYRKKELGSIDRRIRYLQRRLPELKVVSNAAHSAQVFFGAWVTLEKPDGSRVEYRIVGADETHAHPAYISLDSPMARALLKKQADDEIQLDLGGSAERFVIAAVRYQPDRD